MSELTDKRILANMILVNSANVSVSVEPGSLAVTKAKWTGD